MLCGVRARLLLPRACMSEIGLDGVDDAEAETKVPGDTPFCSVMRVVWGVAVWVGKCSVVGSDCGVGGLSMSWTAGQGEAVRAGMSPALHPQGSGGRMLGWAVRV
ncbi:hypothetical protein C6376_28545 [Streptomyces sp. P3]|nr:hypothetical protein C6376_28545 [Streptomyces sp. P3]